MQADLSKVQYTEEELAAIQDFVAVFENVEAQLGAQDEDPGKLDFDDIVEIGTRSFADARDLIGYVMKGRTTRERIDRVKELLSGVERAYGFIEGRTKPGAGATSNP